MKEVQVVQMFVRKAMTGVVPAGALLLAAPARAASVEEMLETAGTWIDRTVDSVAAAIATLDPMALQIGLIAGSVLIAGLGLWLLLRRPRQTSEEREAAAILAQRLPDLRVRTQPPKHPLKRGPRLLEAVAAMKAETAMQAAEDVFKRDRH